MQHFFSSKTRSGDLGAEDGFEMVGLHSGENSLKKRGALGWHIQKVPSNVITPPPPLQDLICDVIKQNESEVKNFCFLLFGIFY